MAQLLPQVSGVRLDEPCFEIHELNEMSLAPGAGMRRIQSVRVVRNDRLCEYRRDLGPAHLFTCPVFILKGHVSVGRGRFDVLETVERMLYIADDSRINGLEAPQFEPRDFVRDYEIYANRKADAKFGRRRFALS